MELLLEDAFSWEEEQQESRPGGAEGPPPSHPLLNKGPLTAGQCFPMPERVFLPWTVGARDVLSKAVCLPARVVGR